MNGFIRMWRNQYCYMVQMSHLVRLFAENQMPTEDKILFVADSFGLYFGNEKSED